MEVCDGKYVFEGRDEACDQYCSTQFMDNMDTQFDDESSQDIEYIYSDIDDDNEDAANEDDEATEIDDDSSDGTSVDGSVSGEVESIVSSVSGKNFSILNYNDVENLLNATVTDLALHLHKNNDEIEYILHCLNWDNRNVRHLFTSMFTSTNEELSGPFVCSICLEKSLKPEECFALGCQHNFCRGCFKEYLASKIAKGPSCLTAHCPLPHCKQAVTPEMYRSLVSPSDYDIYHRYAVEKFMQCSKNMKHCPAPGCDKIAMCSKRTSTICCECSHQFCFGCLEEAHEPLSCKNLSDWKLKCFQERDILLWFTTHTKQCPGCFVSIEKNLGCNHMTCCQCKYEFCWHCLGNWKQHNQCLAVTLVTEWHKASIIPKSSADNFRQYYDQHLQYCEHMKSAETKHKVSQLICDGFVQDALEQVVSSRRVLKYSHLQCYYLPDSTFNKELLASQLELLMTHTDSLYGLVVDLWIEDIDQVIRLTQTVDKLKNSMVKFIKSL